MTVDLSFHGRSPGGRVEDFYTELHRAMYDLGPVGDAPFPSALEFKKLLARDYPAGMDGLCCLDAGCGATAVNTHSLLGVRAGRVLAVDVNQRSLRIVQQTLKGRSKGLSIAGGSLLDLPFASAAFDFVVCSGVVHHTPDPERALRELRRVLKPSGRLYVSAYCFEGSLMFAAVRAWRLAAHVIPFPLMHRLFKRSTFMNNFVLDHMYVPRLWVYRAADFSRALERARFSIDESFASALDRLYGRRIGRWTVTGDGLLRVFVCTAG
jgi:SAM-dependent methyltransferase